MTALVRNRTSVPDPGLVRTAENSLPLSGPAGASWRTGRRHLLMRADLLSTWHAIERITS